MFTKPQHLGLALIGTLVLGTLGVCLWQRTAPASAQQQPLQQPAHPQPRRPPVPKQPPSPSQAATGPVTMSTRLDRTALLRQQDGEVHIAVDLSAAQPADLASDLRKATDVVVVLDISGSMMGDKLAHAKAALRQLLERLNSEDRFALITYESRAQLVQGFLPVTRQHRARLQRKVAQLETAGGTNMSAGLDLAIAELTKSQRSGRHARLLLLSDGHANEGDSTLEGLASRARKVVQQEHVLSTMGIGDDFNEDLMTAMADRGTGNFYYLSRVALLGRFFDAELRAASQTVAQAVELRFTPAQGVRLVTLAGYPIETSSGSQIVQTVRPGNLYAGQQRTLWATVQVPAPTEGREVNLGTFQLHYKRLEAPIALTTPLPALALVDDQSTFDRHIQRPVWEEYVTTEAYTQTEEAIGHAIADGNPEDIEREQARFERNRSMAQRLGSGAVLGSLADLESSAEEAKAQQRAPAPERRYHAKQKKARALYERRSDAYNDDPKLGL